MNADTNAKLSKLERMRKEYDDMMAERRAAKPEPKKEPNAFQKRIAEYADHIMSLDKLDDRREALFKIPSDCRGWVEAEVRIRFNQRKKEKPCMPQN